ncbi:uncharacterized protein LOC129582681 [Paramacrobiotus metropolitanus]|uniref:uncharacterized protein LOC129582681 n=1 Tax=Paramacrobiotus metropolitanus TaxID=2943436 RepID=UPI002445B677|nr:uncharacterized protein LOC129582681 [Paramacrobiotus metropolitanus]XP_055330233.1 uncharacterized protein LOC129582681 [Paramacrobiotus metropolitanus]XP_055330234.1 uncharacterized protein LOC129582681 [Paramacrobiotus metropolitanus]XP_055330235.1 uncharacterized protein LOC129582681 [Paramacrobiotus metropolitanus]
MPSDIKELFEGLYTDHPELQGNAQLLKIWENCSILVETSEKQSDVIRTLKEENSQLKVGEGPAKIEVRIGDKEVVVVNKDTLVEKSGFFAERLTSPDGGPASVDLLVGLPENVHRDMLASLVKSLGNSDLKLSFKRDDAIRMWIAAKYLQMEEALITAEKILRKIMIRQENVWRLWRLARRDRLVDLERLAFQGILQKLPRRSAFADSETFLKCSAEEVIDLLTDNGYFPQSETSVYQAVVRWCMAAPLRMPHLDQLLKSCIVWDSVDIDALRACTTGDLHELLSQILADRNCGQLRGGVLPKRAIPKEAIFYHMREGYSHQLLRYDFYRNELTKMDTLVQNTLTELSPKIRPDGFAVAVGRELIVGTKGSLREGEIIAIDCLTGSWRTLMKEPAFNNCISVVAVGNDVFGATHDPLTWYYCDFSAGQFGPITQLAEDVSQPFLRGGDAVYHRYFIHSMETCPLPDGKIWCITSGSFGEQNSKRQETVVEMYDVRSNKWTKHTGWTEKVKNPYRCGVIIFKGHLYLIGGAVQGAYHEDGRNVAVNSCYRISLARVHSRPESIGKLNDARYDHCVFIKDGKIWVYGGTIQDSANRKKPALSFEKYDEGTNEWTREKVPMSEELQAELVGGDYAQKTVCLALQTPTMGSGFAEFHHEYACVMQDHTYRTSEYVRQRSLCNDYETTWPVIWDD